MGDGWKPTSPLTVTATAMVVLAIAWSAILLYPGGLFVTYGLLLIAARDAIKSKRDSALAHALVFLHKPYKSHLYLWELMEMLRCFLLVGAFQLIQAGSLVQISLATTCSFTFLVIQQHAKPYVDVTNDLLALICSFSLSCFLFMVTLFKADILVEIPVCGCACLLISRRSITCRRHR